MGKYIFQWTKIRLQQDQRKITACHQLRSVEWKEMRPPSMCESDLWALHL